MEGKLSGVCYSGELFRALLQLTWYICTEGLGVQDVEPCRYRARQLEVKVVFARRLLS